MFVSFQEIPFCNLVFLSAISAGPYWGGLVGWCIEAMGGIEGTQAAFDLEGMLDDYMAEEP